MNYQALARRWRPRTFSELVGQGSISHTLINALNQNRVHHAYLFAGTRGVGKTTIARLLAKALNCHEGVTATPCLNCTACQAIEAGHFIDLIEFDAASKTGIEDIRTNLLENIPYAPAVGRYKVYLIDEVHMLSHHSFNALLKTLEEPPDHVKFILATTEPQKIPVTVLSRCLQFNLKTIPVDLIINHLKTILQKEKYVYEEEALFFLAKAAQGSMRDGLSLLDQVLANSKESLTVNQVKQSLGYTQQDYALEILSSLSQGNAQELLNISKKISSEGGHFQYVLDEILVYLHQLTINLVLPEVLVEPQLSALLKYFTKADVQLMYQIALKGNQDICLAPSLLIGFEMTLLRMLVFQPKKMDSLEKTFQQEKNGTDKIFIVDEVDKPSPNEILVEKNYSIEKSKEPIKQIFEKESFDWKSVVSKLKLSGLAANAIANTCFIDKNDYEIKLSTSKGHQSLFTSSIINRLEQALGQYYGQSLRLIVVNDASKSLTPAQLESEEKIFHQQQSDLALEKDPGFQKLKKEFSAELVKNFITIE